MTSQFTWQAVAIMAIATIAAIVRASTLSTRGRSSRRLSFGNVALLISFGIGAWIATQGPYLLHACGQGVYPCMSAFGERFHGEP